MQPTIVATDGLGVRPFAGARIRAVVAGALLLTALLAGIRAADRGVEGRWRLEFQETRGQAPWQVDCVLEQAGERVSGGCTSGFDAMATVRGTVSNGRVTFTLEPRVKPRVREEAGTQEVIREFRGRMNREGNRITGTWRSAPPSQPSRLSRPVKGPFTAERR